MNKAFLLNLLQDYALKKGLRRRLLGSDPYIIKLKKFVHNELCDYSLNEDIRILELQDLYKLLRNRKNSLTKHDQYYSGYHRSYRLTNNLFHKIIFTLAEEKFTQVTKKDNIVLSDRPFMRFRRGMAKLIFKFFPSIYKFSETVIFRIYRNLDPIHFEIVRDQLKSVDSAALADQYPLQTFKPNSTYQLARADKYNKVFLNAFNYSDVLGQKNQLHLLMDNLEDLDPRLLALDDEGNLIFANDVATDFKTSCLLRSPERTVGSKKLPIETMQRIFVTRPLFRQLINTQVQEKYRDAASITQAQTVEDMLGIKPYELKPDLVNGLRFK